MFAQQSAPPSNFFGFAAFSVALHAAVVALVAFLVVPKPPPVLEKPIEVALNLGVAPPPPPPPPPGPSRSSTPKVEKKPRTELRKPDQIKPIQEVKPVEPEPTPEPETPEPEAPPVEGGVEGGVVGGVAGGVVGGVVGGVEGGVVGGTLGGTGTEVVKPKNVPPFVIQRDVVRQTAPRLSEVFKQSHRGQTVHGVYKVCVATDGHVYEVTPVKSVPGADEDIIQGLKDGWEYKPQKVPVCFMYNIPITIT